MKKTYLIVLFLLAGIGAFCQNDAATAKKDAKPAATQSTTAPAGKTAPVPAGKEFKATAPKDDNTPPSKTPIQSKRKDAK